MKKKLDTDEESSVNRLEKKKKKPQSDYLRQLTDIAYQAVEPSPSPSRPSELPGESIVTEETKQQVNIIFIYIYISTFFSFICVKRKQLLDLQVHLQQLVEYLVKLHYDVR